MGKAFIFIFKPKRSNVERPPRNGLPVLMMADQKGRKNEILRTTEKRKSVAILVIGYGGLFLFFY